MSFRTLIISVFAIAVLTGCKIQIKVPTGGNVVTQSGSYRCSEGETCVVDVVDLFFDETFVARPRAGYEFVKWKKRSGGFCGAGKARFKPCRLYTSLFEDIPELKAFLSRDDVFYLQPVFALEDSGGAGGGGSGGGGSGGGGDAGGGDPGGSKPSAAACYNSKMFNKGYRTVLRYRLLSEEGNIESTLDAVADGLSMGPDGRSGNKRTTDIKAKADGQSFTARSESYAKVDNAKKRSTSFAIEMKLLTPQKGTITTVHMPGILTRFDLNKGQSYSQSYNTEITTKADGFSNTQATQTDLRTTYLGTTTVTVPAGSFETCKFSEETTTTVPPLPPIGDTVTTWYGVGTGVLIKSVSSDESTVLLSGSINGKAL